MSDRADADESGRSTDSVVGGRAGDLERRILRALQIAFFAFVIPFIVQSTWLVISQAYAGPPESAPHGSSEWSPCR